VQLSSLIKCLDSFKSEGTLDVCVDSVQYDSRKVNKNSIFCCIEGFNLDGHNFAEDAIAKGASVVVISKEISLSQNVTKIFVPDTRKALAKLAASFYGNPSEKLALLGVTGTNGKTTVTFMLKSIFDAAGKKMGLIGTIVTIIGENKRYSEKTTPESLDLQKLFSEMVDNSIESVAMEVSSHSLALNRVFGCTFKTGIFTNLTRDHLDFHGTFEDYRMAKASLFHLCEKSVINVDDENGRLISAGLKDKVLTYGIEEKAEVYATNIEVSSRGVTFLLNIGNENSLIKLKIPGIFSVYNALAAAAASHVNGISLELIKEGLEMVKGVPGRFELLDTETEYSVILDYAHTPDGLENILSTARKFATGRIITLFGCGGDRDPGKRPLMGEIAAKYSDLCIVTSDNPRTEEPMNIISDILPGVVKINGSYLVEENRKNAIRIALGEAKSGDVVILAGKGHENYQILRDKIIHFDEREIVSEILKGEYC